MGKLVSKLKEPLNYARNVTELIGGRKRKREDDEPADDLANSIEKFLHEPKRKKLTTTSQYIYQALFKEQKNSDVSVMALGKVWHLHKVYLCQSPYFYSMFNGSWKESAQDFIHIKILDPKITVDSLEKVFGIFYSDEIIIEPVSVVSILATATLFQLESIIEKCNEVMIETINAETAVNYYEASCQYGVQPVKKAAYNWLLVNLLSFYCKHKKWLKLIGISLISSLVADPDLYVMQTEFSLYSLLRAWMFLKLFPDYDPETNACEEPQAFFAKRTDKTPFLCTPEGSQFREAFESLRFQHLLIHHVDMTIILADNIIPKEWLHSYLMGHWNSILKIDHTSDNGVENVDNDIFFKNCMRCGRVLPESNYQKWRWTGFNFGLDLVLTAEGRLLTIRRHHKAENERLLSLKIKRQFMIRVTVASLNVQRQVVHSQSTDVKTLNMEKNEEISLMIFENKLEYPLLISVNLLLVTPDKIVLPLQQNDNTAGATSQVPISEIGANSTNDNNNNGHRLLNSQEMNLIENSMENSNFDLNG